MAPAGVGRVVEVDTDEVLVDQAILAEGGQLEDPGAFVRRMNAMLLDAAR